MMILLIGYRLGISIHAPREGCDWAELSIGVIPKDFNPRTP